MGKRVTYDYNTGLLENNQEFSNPLGIVLKQTLSDSAKNLDFEFAVGKRVTYDYNTGLLENNQEFSNPLGIVLKQTLSDSAKNLDFEFGSIGLILIISKISTWYHFPF